MRGPIKIGDTGKLGENDNFAAIANSYLISTRSCSASWVEISGELTAIPLLKIHARIKWCPFVYSVFLTPYFAFNGVLGFYVGFMIMAKIWFYQTS